MKIAAGCIAMLIGVVCLGRAFADYRNDEAVSGRIEIHSSGATFATYNQTPELDARKKSEKIRGVTGGAILAAGLFMLGSRKKNPEPTPAT